jgi:hypothetical protein
VLLFDVLKPVRSFIIWSSTTAVEGIRLFTMDGEESAGSSSSSSSSGPARGVGQDDQGTPDDRMSSVSKTGHSGDEQLMARNNMIHQFEREVSKLQTDSINCSILTGKIVC